MENIMANQLKIKSIDQISEVPSDILYIKRFIGRLCGSTGVGDFEFFFGFSLEKKPIGLPDVSFKYIDTPLEEVKAGEDQIIDLIRSMEKSGELKHSPFEGL